MTSFLISGPIPEGVFTTDPIPEGIPRVEASSSGPIVKKNEEEEEKEEGEIVEVSDSEDNFEVFNQSESLVEESQIREASPVLDIMGIQRKPRTGLLDVMESTSRSKVPEKNAQAKLPPPPPTQPLWVDPADHKRKKDQRSQYLGKGGKGPLPKDTELQKGAK